MNGDDPYDLDRFVEAQGHGTWEAVRHELATGRKRTHWMWFVFPQISGLGRSPMAQRYAIHSRDEARAYLRHPTLGPRLVEATRLVMAAPGSAEQILGGIDAVKLRSSMTLFAQVATDDDVFGAALERFFDGRADPETVDRW